MSQAKEETMTPKEQIVKELEQSPDFLVEEVLNFLLFTKQRQQQQLAKQAQSETKPIWEVADEIIESLPQEAIDELPTDGAAQHDYYLYGTLKRSE